MARKQTEFAEKIKALRKAADMNQLQLAHSVGVTHPLISQCESGKKVPSTDLLVRLGNAAAQEQLYADAEWFWEKAGINIVGCVAIAREKLKRAKQRIDEVASEKGASAVHVPLLRSAAHTADPLVAPSEEIEEWLPLPAAVIANPSFTSCVRFHDQFRLSIFADDLAIVDSSQRDIKTLASKMIAMHQSAEKKVQYAGSVVKLPPGIYVGWLHPFKREGRLMAFIGAARTPAEVQWLYETELVVRSAPGRRPVQMPLAMELGNLVMLDEGDRILGRVVGRLSFDRKQMGVGRRGK